ncbi:MAG: cell division protein FtsQ/DivIB [Actinomycetota bacterium]
MTPTPDRRANRRRLRLPAGWAFSVVGLVVIAAAAAAVTRSAIFAAATIDVRGNHHLGRGEILRLAGVSEKTNLMWFSPGRVEDVLEGDPWIADASVTRALPSTLTISIRERMPIAVVEGGRAFVVASDGTILGPAEASQMTSALPSIHASYRRVTTAAALPASTPGLIVLRSMPASLRKLVMGVRLDSKGFLTVELDGGAVAIYGDASQSAAKAAAVQALLRYAARRGIEPRRIDVRAPDRPAMIPAPTVDS